MQQSISSPLLGERSEHAYASAAITYDCVHYLCFFSAGTNRKNQCPLPFYCPRIAASLEGLTTTTYVRCMVDNPQGPLTVNLTATYNKYTQPAFLGRNATTLPSLLWAESVISNWWMSLVTTFEAANDALERPTYKGRLAISPNSNTLPTSADDIKSLDMLNGNAYFVPFLDKGIIDAFWYTPTANISVLASMTTMNASFPASWEPADYLAKGLYYTVLTDLGQTDSHGTNIFANSDLLAYFTKNFTSIVATGEKEIARATPYGDLPSVPFDPTSAEASTLRIDPSVLATEYLCQVPQLKPSGSLIIAVLIADIVLLKTIWQLYKLVVDWTLQRHHPDMKLCEGCLARHEKMDDLSTVESKLQISSPRGQYQKIHVSERSSVFEE
ncbi:hypothetical protein M409DRAFT_56344 [Zasmidium cellare ATCC 36951]|uniref:Uncharacterized protein n=1 Tax=Zasmidium cellare ATCC 36951 TaxID=1080233 RepID=A0A6A6CD42_ZASCE|nr:uncharacterized protein M409DRAFT_56344 [Zasmidium cellare ATCC 36951]KAF2165005.1 hypothetical protein M409DRAFT_56344 [Zasmidium cellare ATCC 36951]